MTAKCPNCGSIIYSRRNVLCGVCGKRLPPELLFTSEERQAVERELKQNAGHDDGASGSPAEFNSTITKRTGKSSSIAFGVVIALIVVFISFFRQYFYEPTDAPKYVDVQIISYHTGVKGPQGFTVESATGQSWEIDASSSPFPLNYRGPAILTISRGQWTGKDHLRLLQNEPSTNQPNPAPLPN